MSQEEHARLLRRITSGGWIEQRSIIEALGSGNQWGTLYARKGELFWLNRDTVATIPV